jgi:hypothetical protein
MASWLSRLFTVPRKQRDDLNSNPLFHFAAQELRSLAISAAQGAVDNHVSDPGMADAIKASIEQEVQSAIPIPDHVHAAAAVNPEGLLVPMKTAQDLENLAVPSPQWGAPQNMQPEPPPGPEVTGPGEDPTL